MSKTETQAVETQILQRRGPLIHDSEGRAVACSVEFIEVESGCDVGTEIGFAERVQRKQWFNEGFRSVSGTKDVGVVDRFLFGEENIMRARIQRKRWRAAGAAAAPVVAAGVSIDEAYEQAEQIIDGEDLEVVEEVDEEVIADIAEADDADDDEADDDDADEDDGDADEDDREDEL